MAPPANRRAGYSRRAQYNTFYAYVAGVLGIVAGGFFLIGSIASPSSYGALRDLASDATEPLARAATGTRNGVAGGWQVAAGFFTSGSENARLKREVAKARVDAVKAQAVLQENARLKALLGLNMGQQKPVTNAWLIAATNGSSRRFATLSAGANKGVQTGMPVVSPLGLVGRVLEVGHNSARVLLVTDTESVVPVRRASDGLPAFANGHADGTVQIRLITLSINPLHVGDTFVTSGSGGLYWPGTPIAVVSQLTRDGAVGRVLGDPSANEMVEVQPSWTPADDASLPPPADAAAGQKKKK